MSPVDDVPPGSLLAWCRGAVPTLRASRASAAPAAIEQVLFVRETLPRAWAEDMDEWLAHVRGLGTRVAGTHCSKSVELPVYEIAIPRLGLVALARANFYDWKISVESQAPVAADFGRLLDPRAACAATCCEGFPAARVYGSLAADPRRFTVALGDSYGAWTFFWLLNRALRDPLGRARPEEVL